MPRRPTTHLTYRPALDGLRGIAVLAVLVFHTWPTVLPGGWLGVDLFFVLSGYLITSLLVREYSRTGRIDFIQFWTARMRRLLPSLLVVLLAVTIMMALWTLSERRSSVGLDMLAALGYVANWRLLFSDEAYFAGVGTPSPLRHTWSLGIEEQFYLFFPLLLAFLAKWLHKRRHFALVFLILAAASAAWMGHLYTPGVDPTRVYYGTDTRAFELLIGATAGAWIGPRQWGRGKAATWVKAVAVLAWPALLVMVWWFVVVHEDMGILFPTGLVIFSVVSLAPILAAASPHPNLFQRIFAWEPLRQLGLISYALYLWHWPIHVYFTAGNLHLPSGAIAPIQVVVSILLAAATYAWVERPIRQNGLAALLPGIRGGGRRLAIASVAVIVLAAIGLPRVSPLLPDTKQTGATGTSLHYSIPDYTAGQSRSVVLVGNSIPASLVEHFDSPSFPDLEVSQATSFGCTPYANEGELSDNHPTTVSAACSDFQKSWTKMLPGKDTMVYFVPQNLLHDQLHDGKTLRRGTKEHDRWVESTFDTVLHAATDHGIKHVAFVTFACHKMPTVPGEGADELLVNEPAKVEHLNELARTWSKNHGVTLIDQYQFLCPRNTYYGRINGHDLYADALHFTDKSGPIMWAWLAPQLQKLASK